MRLVTPSDVTCEQKKVNPTMYDNSVLPLMNNAIDPLINAVVYLDIDIVNSFIYSIVTHNKVLCSRVLGGVF